MCLRVADTGRVGNPYYPRPGILEVENKAIVDHTTPTLALPSPPSRPIPFAANALQCIVNGEERPQNCPFPLGFRHHAGGPSDSHRQNAHKLVKIARVVLDISWRTDRQTHRQTDVLITILHHAARRRGCSVCTSREHGP